MKRAVIVFTRVPLAGATKTRLMPYLSAKKCAALHTCFLLDIASQCYKTEADIFVYGTPKEKIHELKVLFGERAFYREQQGNDLGERMYHAIKEVLEAGYDACVLIGTDIPEIKSTDLEAAFQTLMNREVVFGPTQDGGYYLVGMKRPIKEVFEKQIYGRGNVLERTVAYYKKTSEKKGQQCRTGYVRVLEDVDVREDVEALRNRIRLKGDWNKSETGKYLMRNQKISIIVPVYNEVTTIEHIQRELLPIKNRCEIIFVDGGSTDGTVERIRPEFRVLHTSKGRAKQMNLGAKESNGDILFFLHSDSELPKYPLEEIRAVMAKYSAGCFGIAFHSRHFFMWTCRIISNHRIKDRKVMFGDQGIFIDRNLFFEAGMYPEIPIMEDYQFSLTLKEMGIKLGMAKHRIYTSDRRFPRKTIPMLKEMWKMNRLRKMYRDGVSTEKISKLYRDVR